MMQAQREFIADASHELRTPLTSILANLELLQERARARPSADGEQGEIVEGALASSQRMRRLIADLLLLARADAGPRRRPRARCDLAEIAEAAVAEVRPVADGHRLELRADRAASRSTATPTSSTALRSTCSTTASATRPPGIDDRDRGRAPQRRRACSRSRDDGPGIPDGRARPDLLPLRPRWPGPADVVADSGTGLGLAIVRAVATSHGGTVEAGTRAEAARGSRSVLPRRPWKP